MAGPVLNVKIFTKSLAHTLRAVAVITFPPAFFFFLIQGIASSRVNPAIGLIPLFFSSAFSAFLLYHEKKCRCQASGLTGTPLHLVCDLLIGIGLLACLILTWVFLPRNWRGGSVMLGTYCSNFLIINFLIHLYFTTQQFYEALMPGASYPTACPHCQHGPFTPNFARGARKGYAPLLDGEGRPSEYRDYQHEEERANGESAARADDAV